MMKYYNQNNEIQENRLELYRYLIDSSYNAEYDKRTSKVIHRKTEGNTLLKRIALIMQFTEKRSLSEEELKGEMLLNDSEIESCMSFAIFYRDETHNYSFELNSFQMYYVIEFLMHKSSEEILEFVSYKEKDVLRIRPEWYDVFELLLSSMKIEDKRRTYLLNWTFRNDIEALLNVDVNSLEDEFKDAIFKTILLDYKKKQIASSPYMDIYLYRKLASFCTTNESLRFFITEYKNETNIGPYLYLLSFVYWSIDKFYIDSSDLTKEYKDVVFQHLQKHGNFEETPWYEALYAPFHNEIFSTQEDIDRLIKLTKEISDTELKISIFRLIEKTDLCDEFIDFAISNERYIHEYKRKGEYASRLVRRDNVLYVLTHIKKYESIKKLWMNYSLLIKDNHGFNDDEIQQNFRRKILLLTEQYIRKHTDLIEDVKRAWIYEYKKDENLAHTPNPIAQDFRDFFVRNNLCTNTKKLCEDLYNALKDNREYEELKQLYLEIILVINKDELNDLAEKWDANDIYSCSLMSWLKNTPIQEINATVVKWINNKFVQVKTPYDNMPSYEQMNSDKITLIFDRSHFKETIYHIIEKLAPINSKDLREKIREDKKEQINHYIIMQYLQGYEDRKSEKYDINAIKESLENDIAYYCFITNVLEQYDKVEFNLSQKKIIEKALKYLASNRESIRSFQIVLRLILRFEIDLDKDTIIDLLPYAGVHYYRNSQKEKYRYFIDYAREKLGNDVIKRNLPKLISPDCQIHDESHLIKIAELIVRLRMAELYSEICKRIKESIYKKIEFTHILFEDKNKGIEALKLQFKNFSSNVQIYILEELSLIPKHQKWTLETTVKYKSSYTSEENKSVLLILLRLGYDKALDEYIESLTNNSRLQASTLNYTDVKYLPKLLILLRIVWDDKDPDHHWRASINDTLMKMAEKNLEQYNAVNESLSKMIEEDKKYSNLNYLIEKLKKSDPRLKDAQISIAQALKIIDGN